ncbi:MAG TPA: TonB family protein [Treponemataceae bacterium]|nr:TonB family protein [Treponemataceae bacterium]
MPRIDTDPDRRRFRAAILIAAALHGLAFALVSFLPTPGLAWVADISATGSGGSASDWGGSGDPSGIDAPDGADGLAGHARRERMRVIPILVAPLGRDELSPRDASPSRAIADKHAITGNKVPTATNVDTDIVVVEGTTGADAVGATVTGNAKGIVNTCDIPGTYGADSADGADGTDSFGTTQRAFAYWLDSAIRARLSYPERARARNAEGTVVVALTVPADGSRCDALVAKTSGSAILDRAAVELIRSLFPAKIAPGRTFSAPVRICFTLTPSPAQ